jgi:hypothetical protein
MSNVLIGIIGVILFIGLALAGALFLGPRFSNSKTDAEAARYMSEGSQISKAYEMYALNEGVYPNGLDDKGVALDTSGKDETQSKLIQMKNKGYLKSIPMGGTGTNAQQIWYIDDSKGAALTLVGSGETSQRVCEAARKQAGFTDTVKACTATDISNSDPCCTG